MFTEADYNRLHELVFQADYPGYRPSILEAPNGDGKIDRDKRYAHVAVKYLEKDPSRGRILELYSYLLRAHELAIKVADAFGLPRNYWPKLGACALRVLEYPAMVGGERHTDVGLFTLSLYRNQEESLKLEGALLPSAVRKLCPKTHRGRLAPMFGLGDPTFHYVDPSPEPQRSIVYFVLPDHALELSPGGETVGEWLEKQMAAMRVAA